MEEFVPRHTPRQIVHHKPSCNTALKSRIADGGAGRVPRMAPPSMTAGSISPKPNAAPCHPDPRSPDAGCAHAGADRPSHGRRGWSVQGLIRARDAGSLPTVDLDRRCLRYQWQPSRRHFGRLPSVAAVARFLRSRESRFDEKFGAQKRSREAPPPRTASGRVPFHGQ
jgi:hypothetical protein